jgi:hypothetical protein
MVSLKKPSARGGSFSDVLTGLVLLALWMGLGFILVKYVIDWLF